MLVVSRKKNQQILFPNLGIAIEILRIAGNGVSVGINAPRSVEVLRGELVTPSAKVGSPEDNSKESDVSVVDKEFLHTLRNQLNKAQLTVAIAQKQLEMGKERDAEKTLRDMVDRLTQIDRQVTTPVISELKTSKAAAAKPNTASQTSIATRHALLVEDDPNERALLAGFLRLSGFEVSEAGDGVEAMEFLETHAVDLIVLDVRMPRMNGLDTVAAIRRHPAARKTKVVIVSGEDRDESFLTASDRNVSEWFSKPLDPNRLVEHLNCSRN